MFQKALLIVNPNSRSGQAEELKDCVRHFEESGLRVTVVETKSPEHACDTVDSESPSQDLIIVAGGDGTIHSVIEPLKNSRKPVAILPFGTANDLARSLGIPSEPLEACKAVMSGVVQTVDLGTVNGKLFFNAAHCGLGVNITHELTPELKKSWGVLGYLKAFINALKRKNSFRVTLEIDDKRLQLRAIHIGIGNGRYYGGGNVVDQRCFINDGRLSLFVLKPQSRWDLLTLTPLLRTGTQRLAKQTLTAQASRIVIKTHKEMEIHADGEPVSHTPAVFEIVPGALKMVCAEGALQPDETTQSMVKMMDWLRSDQDVVLNDLIKGVQESADFFEDAAAQVEHADVREHLLQFKVARECFYEKMNDYVTKHGDLSVMPDPDAEFGSKIFNHLLAKLSTNQEKTVIKQRISEEEELHRLIQTAKVMDFDARFLKLLDQLENNTRRVQDDLYSLLEDRIAS